MLIDVEPLKEIVQLTLQANFVKPFIPTNLLLIAKPETAKTSVLSLCAKKDFVLYANEITAKLIVDILLPMAEKKEVRVLVVPDLLNCIEKQKATRQQFLNTIKSLIEEGITQVLTYHKRFVAKEPVKASMITATTTVDFIKIRKYLESIGLLSRFLPFSYDYPISKVRKILECIEKEEIRQNDIEFKIVKKDTEIQGNDELFAKLEIVATKLGTQYSGFGFRAQERLQRLAKANALLNGRKEVNKDDIEKVLYLSNWINFDFNPL